MTLSGSDIEWPKSSARRSVNVGLYQTFDPINDAENHYVVFISLEGMINVYFVNVRHCPIRCSTVLIGH
jgi:hypothetical protein